jgi:hypothetical protein
MIPSSGDFLIAKGKSQICLHLTDGACLVYECAAGFRAGNVNVEIAGLAARIGECPQTARGAGLMHQPGASPKIQD